MSKDLISSIPEIKTPNISKKKTYIIHQLTERDENIEEIRKEINDNLFSITNFFSPLNPVIINKKIEIEPMKDILSPGSKDLKKKIKKNNLTSTMRSESHKNYNTNLHNNKELMNVKFEKIDIEKLKNIFNTYKDNSIKQSFSLNNKTEETLPLNISKSLSEQNRNLIIRKKSEIKREKLSKYLSKKTHKLEKDLLMNRIDIFKYKKEFFNAFENQKNLNQKYGKNNWLISLRRPEHFKGERETYINLRNENLPLWALIKEKYPIERNISLKPNFDYDNIDYINFRKNQFLNYNNNIIKKIEGVDQLFIQGKNLFNLEYKRELSGSKNKILHKVFMDNGKMIMDKDINEEFGNETIYKSYHNNNDSNDNIESKILKSNLFSSNYLSNNNLSSKNLSSKNLSSKNLSRNSGNNVNDNDNVKLFKSYENPLLENSYKY